MSQHQDFISFLANHHPADGLTKAQIIRMADRLMHGGTWDGEKVVLDVRTPLEMAQGRILELEDQVASLEEEKRDLENNQCLAESGTVKDYYSERPCCPLEDTVSSLNAEIERLQDELAMHDGDL